MSLSVNMSCHCKPLVSLLQRSVRIAQTVFPTVTKAQIGGRVLYQHRFLSSLARDVRNKHIFATQTISKSSIHHFCTKPRSPVEDDYPPLPEYDQTEDLQKKEVFIVHVKGLPWSCTPQDLLQFFSECRIRDGEKGIHLTADRSGRPSGRAFVEVEHEDDLSKALEKHRQFMGSRYVEVYEVTNSDAEAIIKNAAEGGAAEGRSSDCVVRIRGMPYSSSQADIVQFFSGLDIVPNGITIVADHKGRNSGQAYVEFTSQEAFDEALGRNRELIGNRYIEVFPSRKDEIRTGPRNRSNVTPPQTLRRTPPSASNSPHHAHSPPLSSHHVHMRGLPFSASAEDIVEFFSPLAVSKLLLEFGPSGRPSGEADVFFSCHQDAVEAMSRDRMHIGERYIELFLNSETGR